MFPRRTIWKLDPAGALILTLAAAAAIVLAGCSSSSTPAPVSADPPGPTASDTPAPSSTPTAVQVALGSVVVGFRIEGTTPYSPTIEKGGHQEQGIVLGAPKPDVLTQWYQPDGTATNLLTGMGAAWEPFSTVKAGDTAQVSYEDGTQVEYRVARVESLPYKDPDSAVAASSTNLADPTTLTVAVFHPDDAKVWHHTLITYSTSP